MGRLPFKVLCNFVGEVWTFALISHENEINVNLTYHTCHCTVYESFVMTLVNLALILTDAMIHIAQVQNRNKNTNYFPKIIFNPRRFTRTYFE